MIMDSTFALKFSRKGAKFFQRLTFNLASRLGYGKLAMIAACYASAGARRESYATLEFSYLNSNELEQEKLKSLSIKYN